MASLTSPPPLTLRSKHVHDYDRFYIGGTWTTPRGGDKIEVVSPIDGSVVAVVPEPTDRDIDDAVLAAQEALNGSEWRSTTAPERASLLDRLADEIEKRIPEIAEIFAIEIGAPLAVGTQFHQMSVSILRQFAEIARTTEFTVDRVDNGNRVRILKEPVGVVGAIIPWNGPIAAAAFKIGPAIASGCTVVLKAAPEGPLTAYVLAECVQAAGIPAGVINIVPGGREVGEHLVTHSGVDKIAFTGSTAAGRRIMSLCGDRIARLSLELGGKSAAIVAPDIDFAEVLPHLIPASVGHTGQVCAAITRVLLPRSRYTEYTEILAAAMSSLPLGDPFDAAVALGPIAMQRQLERVEDYVRIGLAEGAHIATGGSRPDELTSGFYFSPTLFVDATNEMRIAREEIFGPVVVAIAYDDIDDAIRIANDSPYGLSGAVFTHDDSVAEKVVREVRTGQIFVNTAGLCVTQPFGGFKQSGLGREGGPEGLDGYLETKMVQFATAGDNA